MILVTVSGTSIIVLRTETSCELRTAYPLAPAGH
jgi:hypothetical protein